MDVDTDVDADVDIDVGVDVKSVQVLFNGIEAAVVLHLIILK